MRKVHKNLEEFLARQAQAQERDRRDYAVNAAAGQVLLSLSRELWLFRNGDRTSKFKGPVPVLKQRRRAIDLEAEVDECLIVFQAQANRQKVPLVVKAQTHGKLARADMRPELARCLLVLLFEHVLHEAAGRGITLIVWAKDDRAGVDYRLSGPAAASRASSNGTKDQALTGLTLVRESCSSLGGELTVQAGRGEGLTYRLDFRRKQPRATR